MNDMYISNFLHVLLKRSATTAHPEFVEKVEVDARTQRQAMHACVLLVEVAKTVKKLLK